MRRQYLMVSIACLLVGPLLLGTRPVGGAEAPPAGTAAVAPKGEVTQLLEAGATAYQKGDFVAAEKAFGVALDQATANGNKQGIAGSLNNLGLVYESLGQFEKAADYYTRSLPLFEALGNHQEIAQSLRSLGLVYQWQGKLAQAEAMFAKALQHYEAVEEQVLDPSQVGSFQQANQGSLYGRYAALLLQEQRPGEA